MNKVFEFLQKSHATGRLVHAYLFFGGDMDEKIKTANEFAKLVLATDDVGARLIDTNEHANVVKIRPDGKNIKKEQITFLKGEISKKSLENKAKIYIIEEAEKMSISATNSLLKFLEEPAPDVYIILITHAKEVLIPTIISRLVGLAFQSENQAEMVIEPDFLPIIKQLDQGVSLQVLSAQNSEVFKERISEFLTNFSNYYRQKMNQVLTEPTELQRCTKRLRAVEQAHRNLRYNMNTALCLDQMWIEMNG